jgi:hypothetical protein
MTSLKSKFSKKSTWIPLDSTSLILNQYFARIRSTVNERRIPCRRQFSYEIANGWLGNSVFS